MKPPPRWDDPRGSDPAFCRVESRFWRFPVPRLREPNAGAWAEMWRARADVLVHMGATREAAAVRAVEAYGAGDLPGYAASWSEALAANARLEDARAGNLSSIFGSLLSLGGPGSVRGTGEAPDPSPRTDCECNVCSYSSSSSVGPSTPAGDDPDRARARSHDGTPERYTGPPHDASAGGATRDAHRAPADLETGSTAREAHPSRPVAVVCSPLTPAANGSPSGWLETWERERGD